VVFKFFKEQKHYAREKDVRQGSDFDPASVVSVLSYHDGNDKAFQDALRKHRPGGAVLTGHPCAFVMEAADRNREQIYQSERLDEPAVVECMRQVAAALASVHAKGMLHGDLKLKNIVRLVSSDGKPVLKLIDFDAAVEFGGFAGAKTSTGVCPPELFDQHPPHSVRKDLPADARFDVWSFGVVLYTLLAGDSLFPVNREDNIIKPRELKTLAGWSEVQLSIDMSKCRTGSADAKALLKLLLHPDPARRPTMAAVLNDAFFNPANITKQLADLQNGQDRLQTKADRIFDNTVPLGKVAAAT